jgi:hypothetical protein
MQLVGQNEANIRPSFFFVFYKYIWNTIQGDYNPFDLIEVGLRFSFVESLWKKKILAFILFGVPFVFKTHLSNYPWEFDLIEQALSKYFNLL